MHSSPRCRRLVFIQSGRRVPSIGAAMVEFQSAPDKTRLQIPLNYETPSREFSACTTKPLCGESASEISINHTTETPRELKTKIILRAQMTRAREDNSRCIRPPSAGDSSRVHETFSMSENRTRFETVCCTSDT